MVLESVNSWVSLFLIDLIIGLGDDGPPEVKRARKLAIFDDGLAAR